MIKVDLHMHTCASDGTWDIYELKEQLIKNKINIFSITDHDCIDNVTRMDDIITEKDNLIYLHGVELTTTYEGREYHILSYNYDVNNEDLINLMNWTNENRINSNNEYIKKYASLIYENVNYEDFEKYEYNIKRGGWKSLNYMLDKGIHKDLVSHLADVNKSGFRAILKSPEETIRIAKNSGGKVILAHPAYNYKNVYMPESEMKYWLEIGIDGMECYSPYNQSYVEGYLEFCKKNNLMISGGSDCHGSFLQSRKLGVPHVELKDLNINELLN